MNPTDAMNRLAHANPLPDGLPAPPLEPVLWRLDEETPSAHAGATPHATGPEAMPHAPSQRGRRALRSVVPATAVLVTVAVFVAAAVLLGYRPAGSPPAASPAPRPQSLLSQFAILRRPQTARDRQLPGLLKNMLSEPPQRHDLLASLTHVVGQLPSRGQGQVLVLVIAHGPDPAHPRDIWLLTATSSPDGGGGGVAGGSYAPGQLFPQIGQGYASELVPDAVSRVKWVSPGRTVYPTIRDNVAIAPVSVPRGLGPGLKSVTWYGANGHELAYEDQAMLDKRQAAGEQRAIARETNPALLRSFPVLNRQRTSADQLPGALQQFAERDKSLAPWLSQRVDIPGSRLVEWIVPGRHGYCRFDTERLPNGQIASPALAEHCVPATSLIAGAVALDTGSASLVPGSASSSRQLLATAVFPRQVTSVAVVHRNGTPTPASLVDGFIAARMSAGDRLYVVIGSRRRLALTVRTPLPGFQGG